MVIFNFTCGRCGAEFETPELVAEFAYGELLARSDGTGRIVVVGALRDPAFDEVAQLVRKTIDGANVAVSDRGRGGILQRVFAFACDLDEDGSRFVIGRQPRCPVWVAGTVRLALDRPCRQALAEPHAHRVGSPHR